MNKLEMKTTDIVNENIKYIQDRFPNAIVETEKGFEVDFNTLKQEMSNIIADDTKEKYQLIWPGKKEAILLANTRTTKTLRPLKEKSVDFDNTENIYIEGDNLEALKILQESYLNKIKCIYIDPPYNTGNDFIYNDNFNKNTNEELEDSGQVDEEGNRLVTNTESNGRFHSDWLSMMYSRLKLARNLLKEDGVIFISIDDSEVDNLKKVCNEIFGETNFISQLVIETGEVFGVKAAHVNKTFVKVKDYVLIFAKNINASNKFLPLKDSMKELYDKHFNTVIDNNYNVYNIIDYLKTQHNIINFFKKYNLKLNKDSINILMNLDDEFKKYMYNDLSNILYTDAPLTKNIPNELIKDIAIGKPFCYENKLCFKTSTGSIRMYLKFKDSLSMSDDYEPKFSRTSFRGDLWKNFHIDMRNIGKEGEIDFTNGKKPTRLIQQLLKWINDKNNVILDFFSGSATTAHAVMQLNAEDGGNRKYILVQIPEKCNEKSEAYKNGFQTICDIGEERIRRASKKIKEETDANIDYGFRVYKIDSSNMKDVYYKPNDLEQAQLNLFETNVKDDRTNEDLLTQIILDLGSTLDLKIEEKNILSNKIYYVAENSLVACFDKNIDINIIDEICKCKPLKIVFKEECFNTDNLKINVQERIKKLSPESKVYVL